MKEKSIFIEGVGNISLVKSRRARRISISVRPFEAVKVTLPWYTTMFEANLLIQQKMDWLKKSRARMTRYEQQHTVFTPETIFSTRFHKLVIKKHEKKTLRISIGNGLIRVFYPENAPASHPRVQNSIRHAIEEAWRIEAKHFLPGKVSAFARQHGFKYNRVCIKKTKTRWGSCSAKGNLNLSLHLMMLPDHLIDYVILHELTHTIHLNHGKYFWTHLDKITGGKAKQLAREMKNWSIGIY